MLLKYIFSLLLAFTLSAYDDFDFDGVEDSYDKCPNSSFSDLVDAQGCAISTLESAHKFDLISGISFSQNNQKTLTDTPTTYVTLQLEYFYKDISASITIGGYSDENTTATNDTILELYKHFYLTQEWSFSLGGAIILPTYDTGLANEATDYSTSAEILYSLDTFSLFLSTTYSFINDKDTPSIKYQNTTAIFSGIGYTLSTSTYLSLSYYQSQSIYKDTEDIKSTSLYMYYSINNIYFLTCNYSLGLTDSASENFLSLRFGINF